MLKDIVCHSCGKKSIIRTFGKNGRPWKYDFCNRTCYNEWRRKEHLRVKKDLLKLIRSVWGTTEMKRFEVKKARRIGRAAEIKSKEYLKKEGFKVVADMSGKSNQFYIDFICLLKGKKVLVDATIKIKAYIPEKAYLAEALGMDLYIIHVSPATDGLYHLHKVKNGSKVVRVPMKLIRSLKNNSL